MMGNDTRIAALKMVLQALDEVQSQGGALPIYSEPEVVGDSPPVTFLELVRQYAGNRIPESDLSVAVDTVAPLFPSYKFPWK